MMGPSSCWLMRITVLRLGVLCKMSPPTHLAMAGGSRSQADFRDHNLTVERCQAFQWCDPYYPMTDHDNKTLKEKDVDAEAG